MALPIKDTPTLTGKDAKRFSEAMVNVEPLSKEEIESMKKTYTLMSECEKKGRFKMKSSKLQLDHYKKNFLATKKELDFYITQLEKAHTLIGRLIQQLSENLVERQFTVDLTSHITNREKNNT